MTDRRRPLRWIGNVALLVGSTLFALLAAEWAYRLWHRHQLAGVVQHLTYHAMPWPCFEFDPLYGERPLPNGLCWITYVSDGKVVFGTVASRFNRDRIGGRTTIDEYNSADKKILVFGDSFSFWNQEGVTWPDILQDNLSRATSRNVKILDYGRGGYGVLQMLDLAADKVDEHRPDLVILAVLGDDLTRGRWWFKTLETPEGPRWMISSRQDIFNDYRYAVDEALAQPEATPEWCRMRMKEGGTDPILEKMNARFAALRSEGSRVRNRVPLLSWDHSFLLSRLATGDTGGLEQTLPRTTIYDFADDAKTRGNVARIRAAGIPVILIYIPLADELRSRKLRLPWQHRRLIKSLERMFGQRFRMLQDEYHGPIPPKIDLLPYDGHPNRAGLQLYADGVTPMILPYVRQSPVSRQR